MSNDECPCLRSRFIGNHLVKRLKREGFWIRGVTNRRAAIEELIDRDTVAARVREIMAKRQTWSGSASDLLRAGAQLGSDGVRNESNGWPNTPRALAGRLRRAQTFLRTLGIELTFAREGRAGTRMIRISSTCEKRPVTVTTVSTVSAA